MFNKKPIVAEVCVYFEYKLYRGNRTYKYNSAHFDAFKSPNYPALAEAGVDIKYNTTALLKPSKKALNVHLASRRVVVDPEGNGTNTKRV